MPPSGDAPLLSVVVAARNEVQGVGRLLDALAASTWTGPLEIILVDDHSEDGTTERARAHGLPILRVLQSEGSGKRAALATGTRAARGEILLLTDADCRPAPDWIPLMAAPLLRGEARWVSGPVRVDPGRSLVGGYDREEAQGMLVVTAAGFAAGRPVLAQGASLAYRKADLDALGGYAALSPRASGDDVLLLARFAAAFPGQCRFVADPRAIVRTDAPSSWIALLAQRLRWTSKSGDLPLGTRARMALVYAASWGVLLLPFLAPAPAALAFLALKLGADLAVLHAGARFTGGRAGVLFPLAAMVHPLLVVVSGTLGPLRPVYRWKGRRVR